MGAGASSYESRQKHAFLKQERKKKQAIKRENKRAKQAEDETRKSERDAWLKIQRQKAGESRWWVLAWLTMPIQWWKEKKAWEREDAKRARERNPDHELAGLTSAVLVQPVQNEGVQASGINDGGLIQGSEQLRKRKGTSSE
jgi:hypothetical protein